MHRACILIVVAVAGPFIFLSAGCQKSGSAGPKSAPRIWSDAEAEEVAAMAAKLSPLGADIEVYRWENGFVDGWIQFDGDDNAERTPLNLPRELARSIEGRTPAANRWSGVAIISKTKVDRAEVDDDQYDWYDCKIAIKTTWADGDKKRRRSIAQSPIRGRLKLARGQDPKERPPADKTNIFAERDGKQLFQISTSSTGVVEFKKCDAMDLDGPTWMELRVIAPGN